MSEMRKRRKAAKLTLIELARRSGVNYSTAQAIEAGRVKNSNIKYKEAIAKALGVSGADFFKLWPEERERIKRVREILEQTEEGHR